MAKKLVIIFSVILICITGILLYFTMPRKVNIFGVDYNIKDETIDLSVVDIDKNTEWFSKLNEFKNLKEVNLGNNYLYKDDLDALKEMYPDITFNAVAIIKLYGIDILENTKELDLSNVKVDEKLINYLEDFPNLESVNLGVNKLDLDIEVSIASKYSNVNFNWFVDVNGTYYPSTTEELDLGKENIKNLDKLKKSLSLLKNLKKLEMVDSNLTNEQLGGLREDFPNVDINWKVYFGKWSMRTDRIAFSVLITDYTHKRLTAKDIEVLKYCTKLQALDLGHQAIEDASVIGDYLPDLRILILADNKLTDIKFISKLKKLHYLELFMNNITDLTPLKDLDGLVDLNISYNYKLKNIEPILNLPKLERLWLVHNSISAADYALLRKTYPNATVSNVGIGSTDRGWRTHKRYYALVRTFKNNEVSQLFTMYD